MRINVREEKFFISKRERIKVPDMTNCKYEICRLKDENVKVSEFYDTLLQWVHVHHKFGFIGSYLSRMGYKNVAIYGMAEIGRLLLEEIQIDSDINIVCVVDRDRKKLEGIPCKDQNPDEKIEGADILIVTAIHDYEEIVEKLCVEESCTVQCIDDFLYGIVQDKRVVKI